MAQAHAIVDLDIDPIAKRAERRRRVFRTGVPILGVALTIAVILAISVYANRANTAGALALSDKILAALDGQINEQVVGYFAPARRATLLARNGHDWTDLPHDYAAALRGRIGRVFANGGWLPFLDAETNILLSRLHHTRENLGELRTAAAMLAQEFGLPGLPQGRFVDLSPADRERAMLIRAFLGEPRLLLLSHGAIDPRVSILTRIAATHDSGAATIWLVKTRATHDIREFGAERWLRLGADGLTTLRFTA